MKTKTSFSIVINDNDYDMEVSYECVVINYDDYGDPKDIVENWSLDVCHETSDTGERDFSESERDTFFEEHRELIIEGVKDEWCHQAELRDEAIWERR